MLTQFRTKVKGKVGVLRFDIKSKLSGLPLYKDHILSKVEGVVIPSPVHHIQQLLFINVREFNQQYTDVHL